MALSAQDVFRRGCCLTRVAQLGEFAGRLYIESMDHGAMARGVAPGRRTRCRALKRARLWKHMTERERLLFRTPPGRVEVVTYGEASWCMESAVALGWALGMLPELPGYDETQVDSSAITTLFDTWSAKNPRSLALRESSEIAQAREVAELWTWRARTEVMHRNETFPGSPGGPFEQIIVVTATVAGRNGLFVPVDEDFPVLGCAYRDVSHENLRTLTDLATERLRAFNWLCGHHRDWDKVPLST